MDFLTKYSLTIIPVLISAIFSLNSFKLKWPKLFKHFSIFLWSVILVEVAALLWKKLLFHTPWWSFTRSNIFIYNIGLLIQYFFYCYFFLNILTNPKLKKILIVIFSIFGLFSLLNITVIQGIHTHNNYTIIFGNILIDVVAILFFAQLLRQSEIVRLSKSAVFMLAAGSFIYHLASTPLWIWLNYLTKTDTVFASKLYNMIFFFNVITYTFYSIAFLCPKPTQR